jgi:hypothetical protein
MQNCAILRNALRKRNDELPSISNDTQSSETLRNSLVLNYESPALTAELQALRADTRTSNIQRPTSNDWAAPLCCLGDSSSDGVARRSVNR